VQPDPLQANPVQKVPFRLESFFFQCYIIFLSVVPFDAILCNAAPLAFVCFTVSLGAHFPTPSGIAFSAIPLLWSRLPLTSLRSSPHLDRLLAPFSLFARDAARSTPRRVIFPFLSRSVSCPPAWPRGGRFKAGAQATPPSDPLPATPWTLMRDHPPAHPPAAPIAHRVSSFYCQVWTFACLEPHVFRASGHPPLVALMNLALLPEDEPLACILFSPYSSVTCFSDLHWSSPMMLSSFPLHRPTRPLPSFCFQASFLPAWHPSRPSSSYRTFC